MRDEARRTLKLERNAFVALLIGNDWKNKGLPCLLEALGRLRCPAVELLVVGQDIHGPYQDAVRRHGLEDAVHFLPPRLDVEFYYAAADAYVGASLEDAFGLPVLEAMACGLPVIASGQAGVSEVITHGVDGLILEDPRDAAALARLISELYSDSALRKRLGENARRTACQYTWSRNAEQLAAMFEEALANRASVHQKQTVGAASTVSKS